MLCTFRCPLLIKRIERAERREYLLQPLFYPQLLVRHRRQDLALLAMKRSLAKRLEDFAESKQSPHALLWFQFCPDKLKYQVQDFSFTIKSQYYSGKIGFASFELKGSTYVFVPSFSSHFFALAGTGLKNEQLVEETARVLELILKDLQSQQLSQEEFLSFTGREKDSIEILELAIDLPQKEFRIQQLGIEELMADLSEKKGKKNPRQELQVLSKNLNDLYPSELLFAPYREELVKRLELLLYGSDVLPLVLLGQEGVGRHSIVQQSLCNYIEEVQEEEQKKEKPRALGSEQQIWQIDPNRLISGMSVVGAWQRRLEGILDYISKTRKEEQGKGDILLVNKVVPLLSIGRSAQNSMCMADVMKPYLEKRQLRMLLIATPEEWKILQEKKRSFTELFQVFRIAEPDSLSALNMLLELRKRLEEQESCQIEIEALRTLDTLCSNYFPRKAKPGIVAKILRQAAKKQRFSSLSSYQVEEEFRLLTGLKQSFYQDSRRGSLLMSERLIGNKLIGQPQVVQALAALVQRLGVGLNRPNKPLASMLFIGPTGVGKTEAAKVLSAYLMGSEDALMRFDMNEYVDSSALSRLIGDSYNPEGQLSGRLRYRPFAVLLFDEIEKAHPMVHDLLLQVLDDARLTDAQGRQLDFSNTVIIMTSNLGASELNSQVGFETGQQDPGPIYKKAIRNFFRPEFVNRIEQTLIFNSLRVEDILEIAKLQIRQLLNRDGFIRRTSILNIEEDALNWVARRGFEANMGGRALKRQIEKDLTAFSANLLLENREKEAFIFHIRYRDGKLEPHLENLDFVEPLEDIWMPPPIDERHIERLYQSLLQEAEKLLLQFDRGQQAEGGLIETKPEQWLFYQLKNRLQEKKAYYQHLLLNIDQEQQELPDKALRIKQTGVVQINAGKTPKQNPKLKLMKEQLFSQSALDELRYVYQQSPQQFSDLQSHSLKDFLDMAFLQVAIRGLDEGLEDWYLHIEEPIKQQSSRYSKGVLRDLYRNFFDALGINYELVNSYSFHLQGYALERILGAEQGYHLFYIQERTPLPLRLRLSKEAELSKACKLEDECCQVLRIYDMRGDVLDLGYKASTLSDLRSSSTSTLDLSGREFSLMVYAGFAEEDRLHLW